MSQTPRESKLQGLDIEDMDKHALVYAKKTAAKYPFLRQSPEDFVDDGWIALLEKWTGPEHCSAVAFLLGSVKYAILKALSSPEHKNYEYRSDEYISTIPDSQPSPEQALISNNHDKELLAYIREIDNECAELAKWVLKREYRSLVKISVIMGVEYNHLHYIKRKLLGILRQYESIGPNKKPSSAA